MEVMWQFDLILTVPLNGMYGPIIGKNMAQSEGAMWNPRFFLCQLGKKNFLVQGIRTLDLTDEQHVHNQRRSVQARVVLIKALGITPF
jgi:hypothetical protein